VKPCEEMAVQTRCGGGSARFVFRGEPFHRAGGGYGLRGLRLAALLGCFQFPASQFQDAPARDLRVEHFQGAAAGIDLIVMGEIGEAFEDAEQLLVPEAAPDLHIAGAALRTERTPVRNRSPAQPSSSN